MRFTVFFKLQMSFFVKNILIFKKYHSEIDKTLRDHRAIFFIIFSMYHGLGKCNLGYVLRSHPPLGEDSLIAFGGDGFVAHNRNLLSKISGLKYAYFY
jgi:hypothetical protein